MISFLLIFLTLIQVGSAAPSRLKTLASGEPRAVLKELGEIRRQKPGMNLWVPEKDWLRSLGYPAFKRVDSLDYSVLSDVPRFASLQNRVSAALTFEVWPDAITARRWILTPELARQTADLLFVDDFFPLMPGDESRVENELSRVVFMTNAKELDTVDEKSAIRSLQTTQIEQARFSPKTPFEAPMGRQNFSGALTYAMDAYVLYHNGLGRQTFEFFRDLQSQREKGNQAEPLPFLEEMDFKAFINFLQSQDMVLYYPDPFQEKTREHGLAFLCQLLWWLEPQSYEKMLESPKSPVIQSIFERLNTFLKEHKRVLKPKGNLEDILNAVNEESVLANLPEGFDPISPVFDWELPSNYDLYQVGYRLSFGFVPESVASPEFVKASYTVRNKEILDQKEQERLAEIARRKERERRMRERRRRGQEQEPVEESFEEEFKDPDAPPSHKTTFAQLMPLRIGRPVVRRHYALVPGNAPNPKLSAYMLNSLLLPEVQRALSIQPYYLRPVRSDSFGVSGDIELYVPRLVSMDDADSRKANQWFGIRFRLPQSEVEPNALPLLNPFYLRAFEVLPWDK